MLVFFDVNIGPFSAGRFVIKMTQDSCPVYCNFLWNMCAGSWATSDWVAFGERRRSQQGDEVPVLPRDGLPVVPSILNRSQRHYADITANYENFALPPHAEYTMFSLGGFAPSQRVQLHNPAGAPTCRTHPATAASIRAGSVLLGLEPCVEKRDPPGIPRRIYSTDKPHFDRVGTYWILHIVTDTLEAGNLPEAFHQHHLIGSVVDGLDIFTSVRHEQTQGIMHNCPLYCQRGEHGFTSSPFRNFNTVKVVRCGVL